MARSHHFVDMDYCRIAAKLACRAGDLSHLRGGIWRSEWRKPLDISEGPVVSAELTREGEYSANLSHSHICRRSHIRYYDPRAPRNILPSRARKREDRGLSDISAISKQAGRPGFRPDAATSGVALTCHRLGVSLTRQSGGAMMTT